MNIDSRTFRMNSCTNHSCMVSLNWISSKAGPGLLTFVLVTVGLSCTVRPCTFTKTMKTKRCLSFHKDTPPRGSTGSTFGSNTCRVWGTSCSLNCCSLPRIQNIWFLLLRAPDRALVYLYHDPGIVPVCLRPFFPFSFSEVAPAHQMTLEEYEAWRKAQSK